MRQTDRLQAYIMPKVKAKKIRKNQQDPAPVENVVGQDAGNEDDEMEVDDEVSALNEKVVQFFEDRPYFYDIEHDSWSNKKLKDAELKTFAQIIGWNPVTILREWKNWRSDYGKLKRFEGKSGQGVVKKTQLQKWKLQRFAFLAPYIVRRSCLGIEIGGGADDDATEQLHEDSSNEESVPTGQEESPCLPGPSTSTSRPPLKRKKPQKRQSGSEVGSILSKFLEENRKKDTEIVMKIDQQLKEQRSERDTFAAWLSSVVQQVPSQMFRSFQTEVFGLSLRYLQSVSIDGPKTSESIPMVSSHSLPTPSTHQFTTPIPFHTPMQNVMQPPHFTQPPQQHPNPVPVPPHPHRRSSSSVGSTANIISQAYSSINEDSIDGEGLSTSSTPIVNLDDGLDNDK